MSNGNKKDYYKILGINPSAQKEEVKSAYRKLARKYHPDVNTGNRASEIKFKEIGEAYDILSNDSKRRHYDITNGFTSFNQKTRSNQAKSQAKNAYTRNTQDYKEKKKTQKNDKEFNEVFSEFLDGIFKKPSGYQTPKAKTQTQNNTQKQTAKPLKGNDITTDVSVSIQEAKNGTVRNINIIQTNTCKKCLGKKFSNGAKCTDCKGAGEISSHKKISVKIPPNIKNGSKVKIVGEGNRGKNGGANGDLLLNIKLQKNNLFSFEELNVSCEVPISVHEAILGAEIEVPTVDGFITMKIPAHTQSGQKFRLTNQGLSDDKNKTKGDHIVIVKIDIPKKCSKEELELFKQLKNISNYNPRESLILER